MRTFLQFVLGSAGALVLGFSLAGCTPYIRQPGPTSSPAQLARSHFVTSDGAVLPLRSWLPLNHQAQAALIALHGFNDYSRFFESPGRYLSGMNVACYAYDQRGFGHAPGHGLWSGTATYARDLTEVVNVVRQRHPGLPVYLLGESMGGAIAISAMTRPEAPPVDGLILASPAVWNRASMPWYQRWLLATAAHTVPWLRLTGSSLHILASDNIAMLRELGRDPRVIKETRIDAIHGLTDLMDEAQAGAGKLRLATLVLYGEKDEVVPREPVFRMLDRIPKSSDSKTAIYPNGYHLLLRDLKAETAWKDIAFWMANHQAPLPSGVEEHAAREMRLAQKREPIVNESIAH